MTGGHLTAYYLQFIRIVSGGGAIIAVALFCSGGRICNPTQQSIYYMYTSQEPDKKRRMAKGT